MSKDTKINDAGPAPRPGQTAERKMNRHLIRQKIKVLNGSRRIIARGDARGICKATRYVESEFPALRTAAAELREYLSKALGPHAYLEGYVAAKTRRTYETVLNSEGKMRVTRLAWIDWIIAQYESKLAARTNGGGDE